MGVLNWNLLTKWRLFWHRCIQWKLKDQQVSTQADGPFPNAKPTQIFIAHLGRMKARKQAKTRRQGQVNAMLQCTVKLVNFRKRFILKWWAWEMTSFRLELKKYSTKETLCHLMAPHQWRNKPANNRIMGLFRPKTCPHQNMLRQFWAFLEKSLQNSRMITLQAYLRTWIQDPTNSWEIRCRVLFSTQMLKMRISFKFLACPQAWRNCTQIL